MDDIVHEVFGTAGSVVGAVEGWIVGNLKSIANFLWNEAVRVLSAIALPQIAVDALKEQRERQKARDVVTGWVFDRGDGERLHAESFRGRFERAMQDAGVPRLTPHGLRHTGATALARAGVSPKTLAARLGHSSVTITFDLYAHALVDDQRDAAEAFGVRLAGTG